MSSLRKILLPLLLIPLGMILYGALYPDWQWESPGLELLFVLVGIPIVAVNFIAWFYPEVIQTYLPIRENWLQSREKPILLAAAISALVAFAWIWFGAVSAVVNADDRPGTRLFDARPITATAFAHSVQALSRATTSGELAVVSTPRASPQATQDIASSEATLSPEDRAQIPVSGGELTGSPAVSSDSPTLSSTSPTRPVTQTKLAAASTAPTGTALSLGGCTPATSEYVQDITETVQDMDPENVVVAGWMVQSTAAKDLWFVAAKVQSDTGTTSVGVWGLFTYSDGTFDIYAINQPAMDLSYADWGEDAEPVLTMQSNGAQAAYNCAQ
jgi:hypothetical protein